MFRMDKNKTIESVVSKVKMGCETARKDKEMDTD